MKKATQATRLNINVFLYFNSTKVNNAISEKLRYIIVSFIFFSFIAGSFSVSFAQTCPSGAVTWTAKSATEANQWNSITYGNGIFVAVATTGTNRVMTSPDGINWTARTAAEGNGWISVTYGNGLFVAVAANGTNRVMTSPDGITWTAQSTSEANSWQSVTYGNGLFVAVSGNGTNRVMTSSDGINWTARTAAEASGWISVTYGNGLFVAVATTGTNRVMTSPDGINWTAQSASEANSWRKITYGNGLFVAVSNDGTNRVMTSTDGINWTARVAAEANQWIGLGYGNGLFVATSINGTNRVMTSQDGITWTARAASELNQWYAVTYGNGQFVAVSINGNNRVMTSSAFGYITGTTDIVTAGSSYVWNGNNYTANGIYTDTITTAAGCDSIAVLQLTTTAAYSPCSTGASTWTSQNILSGAIITSITNGNGIFVATTNVTNSIMTSPDGVNWTARNLPVFRNWNAVTYGNGVFVAVGAQSSGTNMTLRSTDGINWTAHSAPASNDWSAVTYGNNLFVATSFYGPYHLMTSPDGITWSLGSVVNTGNWGGITYGNGIFVTVSAGGANRVMTSTDGLNWTSHQVPEQQWRAVTYGNGLFVAVASSGTNRVMTSLDGFTWTERTAAEANSWQSITFGNGLFVAVSSDGTNQVMTSSDGVNWTAKQASEIKQWRQIAYGNNKFVAGSGGTNNLMTSPASGFVTGLTDTITTGGTYVYNGTTYTSSGIIDTDTLISSLGCDSVNFTYLNVDPGLCPQGGVNWTSQIAGAGAEWRSIAYGNGTYVAIAYTGTNRVMTSPDGINWTARTASQANGWTSVTYGNGLFVAVAETGTNQVMTSLDGITWTNRTAAQANFWTSVTYGNGLFVAVSQSGTSRVMTSPNGTTWTSRTAAEANAWYSVTYGNGLFVAVAISGTNRVMTSPDGITWTARAASEPNNWHSVTYGNGLYVAVSQNGTNRVMTSTDAITWTARSTPIGIWSSVTSTVGLFVAVSPTGGNNVMTSLDGITWTARNAATSTGWFSVTYAENQFVAVAASGAVQVMTSPASGFLVGTTDTVVTGAAYTWNGTTYSSTGIYTDTLFSSLGCDSVNYLNLTVDYSLCPQGGINWTSQTAGAGAEWRSIAYGNGTYVAIAYTGTNRVMTSPDGINWTARTASQANGWTSVTYGNGLFVAVAETGTNRVMTSPDGITWTNRTAAQANFWTSVTYGNGLFVAVSQSGTSRVMTSPNGTTWTSRTAAEANTWYSVTYGNGLFVAVATSGTNRVMTSPDGITWTARAASEPNNWHSVTYGNGLYVAVSQNGTNRVMTSTDAITWTARATPIGIWSSVTSTVGLFVAVSPTGGNNVMTSLDGITWTARNAATSTGWFSVTYAENQFVAVAASGAVQVMTSPASGFLVGTTDTVVTGAAYTWNGTTYTTSGIYSDTTTTALGCDSVNYLNLTIDYSLCPQGAVTWTAQSAIDANSWRSIVYGDGIYVGVASFGTNRIATSTDGINWIPRTAPEDNEWNSVTYGNGLFVAVAQTGSGRVMTSTDGINWTSRTATEANAWSSVTYGNGHFVSVAYTGTNRVMTSSDGINWTSRSASVNSTWLSVTYGNGTFVATAFESASNIMTSPDGINWTTRSIPTTMSRLYDVTYGNGLFVAVAETGSNRVVTSPDGINWTARVAAEANSWRSIAFGNGLFVATAISGTNRVMTSPDGITWTSRLAEANNWSAVTYGNGQFVAVASSGTNRAMTSSASGFITGTPQIISVSGSYVWNGTTYTASGIYTDTLTTANGCDSIATLNLTIAPAISPCPPGAVNWTAQTPAEANQWRSVAYGNGTYVAVAINGTNRVMTSPDGVVWTARTAAEANNWVSVTYGNGLFVAVSTTGTNRVMTSPDGITWTPRVAASASQWLDVTYGNGLFVAVTGDGTNRIMTSPDGITWTGRQAPEANQWYSVTYGNGLFVAVSTIGTNRVMTSPDGITWTGRTAAENNSWLAVTFGNDQFVAVSSDGTNRVMTSPDGINWTSQTAPLVYWINIAYGNGIFVASALLSPNGLMTSTDGITWAIRTAPSNSNWYGITHGNGKFVAVASSGAAQVVTSPDISPIVATAQIESVCNSYTWPVTGLTYTSSGTYTDTLTTALGCDSIVTLNLSISTPTFVGTDTVAACGSYTWLANNQTYTTSGIYTHTYGCDSSVALNLTITPTYTPTIGVDGMFTTSNSAIVGSQLQNIGSNQLFNEVGFVYSKDPNPDTTDLIYTTVYNAMFNGKFEVKTLTNLDFNTTYYVKSYFIINGCLSYSPETNFTTLCINLNGNYSVGGANADFDDVQEVASALNSCGITGPVVFNIAPGTYAGAISLNQITGTSSTNTITFVGADTSNTIITHDTTGGTNKTIQLAGTDYVTFKKLKITNTATGASSAAIAMGSQADYITIDSCAIAVSDEDVTNVKHFGIWAGNGTAVAASNSNLFGSNSAHFTLTNSSISGQSGVYIFGNSTANNINHHIENCLITNYNEYGIRMYFTRFSRILENTLIGKAPGNVDYSISMTACKTYSIAKNHINRGQLYSNSTNGSASDSTSVIAHNMIRNDNGAGGIITFSDKKLHIVHNTILSSNTTALQINANTDMDVKNNIVVANSNNNIIAQFFNLDTSNSIDYNIYYRINGSFSVSQNSTNYTSLAAWQTAFPEFNANSIFGNPNLISASDLHLSASGNNNGGIPIAGLITDIDGDTLSTTTPDIGADEYVGPALGTVLTLASTNINASTATLNGNVTNAGNTAVLERGFVYALTNNPDTTANRVINASATTGTYDANINGLTASTTYYVRAYMINAVGIIYGVVDSFTTCTPSALTFTATPDSACFGGTSNISVSNGNSNPITYLWSTGATTSSITTPALTSPTTYAVSVTENGCTSVDSFEVGIRSLAAVTTNPLNTSIQMNQNGQLTVAATGTNLTYQWQVNSGSGFANLSNDATYSGVTNDTLAITNAPISIDSYQYRCIVNSTCGLDTSAAATLTITTLGNNNFVVNVNQCPNTVVDTLVGSTPTGGSGNFNYLWMTSTTGLSGSFTPAPNTNTNKNYYPGILAQTTYFIRVVIDGILTDTSSIGMAFIGDTVKPTAIAQNVTIYLNQSGQATLVASQVNNGSSDNCVLDTVYISKTTFTCADLGANIIQLFAMDSTGLMDSTTATITVLDTIAPIANGQNVSLYLNATGTAVLVPSALDNNITDNCASGLTFSASTVNFGCQNIGNNLVTLTATDASGNTDTVSVTVTVLDTIKPLALAQNITVQLDATGQASITPSQINNGSSDACGIASLALDSTNFDCAEVGPNTVVLTVTDVNGNSSTATAIVTVQDNVAPIAQAQNITIQLNAAGQASITPSQINNGSSDACGTASLALDSTNFDCSEVGPNTVILTVTDVNGNSSTATATVTVQDNVAPIALAQNITIQLDANGQASITPSQINNGSSDACGIAFLALDSTNFDCSEVGANTVVLTVTDVNGNSSTATSTVTVQDNVEPIAQAQNITVQLDANGQASITPSQINNGSSDACGIASLALDSTNFDCGEVGANTVTLTVTDVNGNSSTATAIVTVQDNIAPIALAQNITVQLDAVGQASITPSQINNGSSDACGIASLMLDSTNFDCGEVGANTVVLTVTDVNGNSSTATATVTVQDNVVPIAQAQNITVQLDANGQASITPSQINNGSSDACGIASLALDSTNFDCSKVGANTVVLTVTDVNGNSSTANAVVTVIDTIKPLAQAQNLSIYLNAAGNANTTAAAVNNNSTDACGIQSLTLSQTSFSCVNVGANNVVLTVTDVNGNSSTANAVVTVIDTIKPLAQAQNISIYLNAAGNTNTTATAVNNNSTDACGIQSLSLNQTSFSCVNVGANNVVLTVTDINGNSSTANAVVTVIDTIKPSAQAQNLSIYLNAAGNANTTAAAVNNNSTDACGIQSLSLSQTSFSCVNVGANNVVLTVTDANGISSTANAVVTVIDTIKPLAQAQNLSIYLNAAGNANTTAAAVNNNSTDACGIQSLSLSQTSFSCVNVGANNVVLTVTDANGNSSTANAVVSVIDTIKPLAQAQNLSIYLNVAGNANTTAAAVNNNSTDACGIQSLSLNQTSFNCVNVGANNVVLTVTDVNGNSSSANAVVTVIDTIKPQLLLPAPISVCAENDLGASVQFVVSGSDNCTVDTIIQIAGLPSGSVFPIGTTSNIFEVIDIAGNSSQSAFEVEVYPYLQLIISNPGNICESDEAFNLTAIPSGGQFSGLGVIGGQFFPQSVPFGYYDVKYTYTTNEGCVYENQINLQVRANPIVMIGNFDNPICVEDEIIACPNATPAGGLYVGPGINGNVLSTFNAGVGNHIISYQYQDIYGCSSSDSTELVIVQCYIPTEVEDNIQNKFGVKIYPNPNRGLMQLEHNYQSVLNLEVYDVYGKVIFGQEVISSQTSLDLQFFPKGMYIIRLFDGKNQHIEKIIIQ